MGNEGEKRNKWRDSEALRNILSDGCRRSDGTAAVYPPQRSLCVQYVINKHVGKSVTNHERAVKNKHGNKIQITAFMGAFDSQLQATLMPSLWAAAFDCPASALCARR